MNAVQQHELEHEDQLLDAMVIYTMDGHREKPVVLDLIRVRLGVDRVTAAEMYEMCRASQ